MLSKCVFVRCIAVAVVLCFVGTTDGVKSRMKRSVDKGTAHYIKVFSAYLGEIPMTADIKRMEMNLPSDKKKKIYYLKKSQKYAEWTASATTTRSPDPITRRYTIRRTTTRRPPTRRPTTRRPTTRRPTTRRHTTQRTTTTTQIPIVQKIIVQKPAKPKPYACAKEINLIPKSISYVSLNEVFHVININLMKQQGFTMGHTLMEGKKIQMRDSLEVIFRQPVHLREVEFVGKHNFVDIGITYKQNGMWNKLLNHLKGLEVMDVLDDDKADFMIPRTSAVRIYPQKWNGAKPVLREIRFSGCF